MRTVGIIGGLGPATTAKFYSELVARADRSKNIRRPGILIWSVDLNYEVEKQAIVEGYGQERIIPQLIDAATRLTAAGADFLVMPCNSLHVFIEEIKSQAKVPILSIVEESLRVLDQTKPELTAILGSQITIDSHMYQNAFAARKLSFVLPSSSQIAEIGHVVHSLVRGGHRAKSARILKEILDSLASHGVTHALLACTDLQLACRGHPTLTVIDSFEALLQSTLREIQSSHSGPRGLHSPY